MTNPELDHLTAADSWKDAGTIDDYIRELLQESEEIARLYLRESWIAGAFALLRDTRRAVGLSQQQVADRLGMKQSAIARLEGAEDTKLSTFWKYLAACGQGAADLEAVPIERLRAFALADPGAPRTARVVERHHTIHRTQQEDPEHQIVPVSPNEPREPSLHRPIWKSDERRISTSE
ncbi:MAG: helix-turn-helix domain-containing protein [Chloroflexota bacterium]|nr:helix-turn-helix domain-containing protein [Chloroflexota bacterium]